MSIEQDVIKLLSDLIALPSVNPWQDFTRTEPPYGECRVVDYVENYFRPFGVKVERQEVFPGRHNVLVHIPGKDRSLAPVVLEAHMDTVGVDGMPAAFTPYVADGRLYGRGACDTKGSLAAMMLACRQLLEEGLLPAKNCLLLGVADEEWGTTGIQRFAESGIKVSAAVIGEPTSLQVVSAHNGEIYFKILAHGKAAHTSRPYLGINAITMMSDVIQVLRARATSLYPQRLHPLCGPPQLTASIIQGGSAESVVPATCHVSFDRRVSPGEKWQEVLDEIKGWIAEDLDAETAKSVELIAPHYNMPPFETPVDHPLVLGLRAAVEDTLGHGEVVGVPYGTDAAFLAVTGVPVVVFGPGDIAQAHNIGEYVDVDQLTAAVQILKRFVLVEAKRLD